MALPFVVVMWMPMNGFSMFAEILMINRAGYVMKLTAIMSEVARVPQLIELFGPSSFWC